MNKKTFVGMLCTLFFLFGLVFAVYYFRAYAGNMGYSMYLIFAVLAAGQALFAGLSFYFYVLKNKTSKMAIFTYIVTVVLAIHVGMIAMIWILYFGGVLLLPPAQR